MTAYYPHIYNNGVQGQISLPIQNGHRAGGNNGSYTSAVSLQYQQSRNDMVIFGKPDYSVVSAQPTAQPIVSAQPTAQSIVSAQPTISAQPTVSAQPNISAQPTTDYGHYSPQNPTAGTSRSSSFRHNGTVYYEPIPGSPVVYRMNQSVVNNWSESSQRTGTRLTDANAGTNTNTTDVKSFLGGRHVIGKGNDFTGHINQQTLDWLQNSFFGGAHVSQEMNIRRKEQVVTGYDMAVARPQNDTNAIQNAQNASRALRQNHHIVNNINISYTISNPSLVPPQSLPQKNAVKPPERRINTKVDKENIQVMDYSPWASQEVKNMFDTFAASLAHKTQVGNNMHNLLNCPKNINESFQQDDKIMATSNNLHGHNVSLSSSASRAVPASASRAIPESASLGVPAFASRTVPASVSREVSASASRDVPASASRDVPASASRAVPASASRAVPAPASRAVPAPVSRAVPASGACAETPVTSREFRNRASRVSRPSNWGMMPLMSLDVKCDRESSSSVHSTAPITTGNETPETLITGATPKSVPLHSTPRSTCKDENTSSDLDPNASAFRPTESSQHENNTSDLDPHATVFTPTDSSWNDDTNSDLDPNASVYTPTDAQHSRNDTEAYAHPDSSPISAQRTVTAQTSDNQSATASVYPWDGRRVLDDVKVWIPGDFEAPALGGYKSFNTMKGELYWHVNAMYDGGRKDKPKRPAFLQRAWESIKDKWLPAPGHIIYGHTPSDLVLCPYDSLPPLGDNLKESAVSFGRRRRRFGEIVPYQLIPRFVDSLPSRVGEVPPLNGIFCIPKEPVVVIEKGEKRRRANVEIACVLEE